MAPQNERTYWQADLYMNDGRYTGHVSFSMSPNGTPGLSIVVKEEIEPGRLVPQTYTAGAGATGPEVNRFIERAYLMLREYRATPKEAGNDD